MIGCLVHLAGFTKKSDETILDINSLVFVLNKMNGKDGHYAFTFLKPKSKNSVFIDSFMCKGKIVNGFYRRRRKKTKK